MAFTMYPSQMRPRIFLSFLALMACFVFTGCHYHLGNSAPLPFESIYIEPIENDSYAPQIQALLTNQLRQAFLKEGRPIVVDKEAADASLKVCIKKYNQSGSALDDKDTYRARTITVSVSAVCSLINNQTGKPYFLDSSISADNSLEVDGRFQSGVFQLLPIITETLADKIVNFVVSTW